MLRKLIQGYCRDFPSASASNISALRLEVDRDLVGCDETSTIHNVNGVAPQQISFSTQSYLTILLVPPN